MPALYWQQAPMIKKDINPFVSFFSNQSGVDESVLQNIKQLKLKRYTSIILTNDYNQGNGNGVRIVSSNGQLNELEGQLVYSVVGKV